MQEHVANRKLVTPADVQGLFGGKGSFRRWPYYSEGDALLAPAGANFALANPTNRPLRYLAVKCRAGR